jgi:alpha-galactosidase
MDGIVSRSRMVNGVPTSLRDLGYSDVGLDDAWQKCGNYGSDNNTYHDESGRPVIDVELFPDFNALTDYAHSIGLTAGWYGNNCICEDHCSTDACYQEDVNALVSLGFDSVKLDGCGQQEDLQKWSDMITATGHSILIENCHWGYTIPSEDGWCPFNMYRTSGDIRSNFDFILSNLLTTVRFNQNQLSYPGCWAYPDMLEVGCEDGPNKEDYGLTYLEARTHFGAWCIVSSPLVLSHDLTDEAVTEQIWSIITNTEAIAINQAWDGDAGESLLVR